MSGKRGKHSHSHGGAHGHSHDDDDHEHDHDHDDADEPIDIKSALAANPQLRALFAQKLQSMTGQSSGLLESFPEEVKRRVKALKKLHSEHLDLETKMQEEINELEKKYLKLSAPLYEKRAQIAAGTYEPTEEECDFTEEDEEEEEEEEEEEGKEEKGKDKKKEEKKEEKKDEKEEPVKGIPTFWLTTLRNYDTISELIHENDEPLLEKLTDIKIHSLDDNPGFTLEFVFEKNDYFNNASLKKTYRLAMEKGGDMVYEKSTGCTIDWKADKNLTVKTITKTQRHKGKGTKRTVTVTVPNEETFFNFFNPPKVPETEEEEPDEELEARLNQDFEIGEALKSKIIPHAIQWFTGDALAYEDDDYEDEDYEDEDDGEEGEGDEDEDDDDDDGGADYDPKKASGQKPPECKQQ